MPARIDQLPPDDIEIVTGDRRLEKAYLMVADDNTTDGAVYREALLQNNYACDVVRTAEDVLRAFLVRDYDAILLNLRSPLPVALTTVRAIREKERHYPEPRVPIVIFSAGGSATEREQALEAGVDEIVRKPSDYEALQALLDNVLSSEPRTPAALIPREPLNYHALVASCQRDEDAAQKKIADFAALLHDAIRDVRTAVEAKDVELLKRVGENLRQEAIHVASGRVQRTAVLLARLNSSAGLRDQARELVQELKEEEQDLAVWRALNLGQAIASLKSRTSPAKTTILKLSNFLKNRLDIFSRAP